MISAFTKETLCMYALSPINFTRSYRSRLPFPFPPVGGGGSPPYLEHVWGRLGEGVGSPSWTGQTVVRTYPALALCTMYVVGKMCAKRDSLPLHQAIWSRTFPWLSHSETVSKLSCVSQSCRILIRKWPPELASAWAGWLRKAVVHSKEGKYKERSAWNLVWACIVLMIIAPGLRSINASPGIKLFLSDLIAWDFYITGKVYSR